MTLVFNWGKDSIGWAVFKTQERLNLLGTGTLTFSPNSAFASERRNHRRQRRHIRSTRQRIVGIKRLLNVLGVLTEEELNRPGCAWPWLLAAQVLRGGKLLTWSELWDVLRWYAHNRGYDGNRRWSYLEDKIYVEESEKEKNAIVLMEKHGTTSMAETLCAELGLDPLGSQRASQKRFKGANAAFPRKIVEDEVSYILKRHIGHLPKIDEALLRTLLGNNIQDKKAWQTIPCDSIHLPQRFEGGLIFGQLMARYDNRDLLLCPISYAKVILEEKQNLKEVNAAKRIAEIKARTPSANCREFYRYQWAKLLSRVEVIEKTTAKTRFLTQSERERLTRKNEEFGYLTVSQFKKAVREITESMSDNSEKLLQSDESKGALLLNPIRKLETSNKLAPFWNLLPERLQKRFRGQWLRHHALTLAEVRSHLVKIQSDIEPFDREIEQRLKLSQARKRKLPTISREELMRIKFYPERFSGRAPYTRALLAQATLELLEGRDPHQPGGALYLTEEMRRAQIDMPVSLQTKSHWVRHRMLALERLVKDLVSIYAAGDLKQIKKVVFKVDHLSSWSMKFNTTDEKSETEKGLDWQRMAKKLQLDKKLKNYPTSITAELLNKACIAEDLGWRCPYTGEKYHPIDLVLKRVDKDYIEPDLKTFSNSLDSLVLTFAEIQHWKGKRSAFKFVEEETGKSVPNLPHLSITSPSNFRNFVENLEPANEEIEGKSQSDLPSWHEIPAREISLPFSLTQIGARVIEGVFKALSQLPEVVTLSKTLLGIAQQKWNLEKYLNEICPQLQNHEKHAAHATYLSRAAKACLQGLASYYLSEIEADKSFENRERNLKRYLSEKGKDFFDRELPAYLKQQIKEGLAAKQVIQFLPSRMRGLKVEQNMWRVVSLEDAATLQQRIRNESNLRPYKVETLQPIKLLGLYPEKGKSKLKRLKGALIMRDNFGVTTQANPEIVPFHKVWKRLQKLKQQNGNKLSLFRNGQLIVVPRERQRKVNRWVLKGAWRIFSIKNNRNGVALDLGYPDAIKAHMINISLSSLLKAGAYCLRTNLAGKEVAKVLTPKVKNSEALLTI